MNKVENMPSLDEVDAEVKRETPIGGDDFKRMQSAYGSVFAESQHSADESDCEELEYQTVEDVELNSDDEEDSMQEAYFEGERAEEGNSPSEVPAHQTEQMRITLGSS